MIDMLIDHFFEVEPTLTHWKNMFYVIYGDLKISSTHLQDLLSESQQVEPQFISVLLRNAGDYYLLEDNL